MVDAATGRFQLQRWSAKIAPLNRFLPKRLMSDAAKAIPARVMPY
jgi:hypothetical protein